MTENLEKIKDVTNEFFAKTGASNFEIKIIETGSEESLNICFLTDDPSSYIGERGRNISVFETVLRLILKKKLNGAPFFHLDVNNYRSLRDGSLKELAKKAAHKARFYKREVVLEPMTAYDRRIIHIELSAHPDIKTESAGEGEERRVVIKYIN
ncbi:MAG: hypothetical protein HYW79_00895 [Parcubacteria group bacterium]|nr:hypothetical protein [Parcubacteria group bacterium]